ncbi:MAG: BlaI/MecI/CopY family transcriptional regulator [Fimbriimonas ginsengisoli]|uniref:BlaI/MecI/CopY family transcriptional regulator n=1 Tax=Fimbriimonas ginsengisoli TaxID=1005039 RepID=A0A931LVT6_FIMGI|nr:BlaI/MecI/CopY family transcriptional regulator [Fimbriimonas ginsengisoli]
MRKQTRHANPTNAELEILRVLWQRGPSTVREVHDALASSRDTGYTTVLKLLQIMAEKGLVRRDESERAHVYRPAESQASSQRTLVGDMLDKVFGGSAEQLVMHALAARPTTPEELAAIRRMIDELEEAE